MSETLVIHTDGGARGNPGPAAVGVVFEVGDWQELHGRTIGETTNNVAEYTALQDAVAQLPHILEEHPGIEKIEFYLDSQLVVRQMIGEYKIKEPTLQMLARGIHEQLQQLAANPSFTYVPRAQNKMADKLVNQALDGQL